MASFVEFLFMGMLDKARLFFFYDGLSKTEYESIESYIIEENDRRLRVYNYVAFAVLLGALIASIINSGISPVIFIYIIGIISSAVMIHLLIRNASTNFLLSKIVNHCFVSMVLLFTAFTVFNDSKLPATVFLACLALIPYITYSKNIFGLINRTIIVIVFLVVSFANKSLEYFLVDLFNVLLVFAITTVAGMYFQKLQINSYIVKYNMDFEIKKISGVFEKIQVINLISGESIDYSKYDMNDMSIIEKYENASKKMDDFIENYVSEKNRPQMSKFCNVATLEDRMYKNKVLEKDFVSAEGIWERAVFVSMEENDKGFPTKVAFLIKRIADPYYIKALKIDINNIP